MLTKLPEKWAIERNNQNYQVVNKWISEGTGSNAYSNCRGYIHFPNFNDFEGFKKGGHSCYILQRDYTLITFDDFKRLVLKQDDFVLPEKWAVARTQGNHRTLNNWINDKAKTQYYQNDSGYIIYPSISLREFDRIANSSNYLPADYTLISFEQFEKYVLNQKTNKNEQNLPSDSGRIQERGISGTKTERVRRKRGEIAVSSRLIGNPTKARQIRGKIQSKPLSNSVLSFQHRVS